ncbi:hypothetical protein HYV86_06635 [Candidatus Woesearchaeota archaeon]|nr:hypothetical protein [Candidatus Woesearchaeota archaeon]
MNTMNFVEQIKQNNATHVVNKAELAPLLSEAQKAFVQHFSNEVYFDRSIFINWTCAIADCKYCYLSTKPKHTPGTQAKAVRSQESVLAEALLCKIMGWNVGYITGGLRVESVDYLCELTHNMSLLLGEKIMLNFGPHAKSEIVKLKPYIKGMGSAIESFDPDLHQFICPSKPLRTLMMFLENLQHEGLNKLITIILGIGEKKEDVEIVIENIKKYEINRVQLCFLKPQENTVFADVPSPDPLYMAWWIARIRIACPTTVIKVALVRDRISDLSLYLSAGANGFSRFMVFKDFASPLALELERECAKAGRVLQGNFTHVPVIDAEKAVNELPFDQDLKKRILPKFRTYYENLQDLESGTKKKGNMLTSLDEN